MNTLKLNKEYKMNDTDKGLFTSLPDNTPDTKWTGKQQDIISKLYHTYCAPIDNIDWIRALVDMERAEKWPSGPRMSKYGAMYICVNFIFNLKDKMTATDMWHTLNGREAYRRICKWAYCPY